MYVRNKMHKTSLNINKSTVGEPIHAKIRRMVTNKEPISGSEPLIYTERKDGVNPEHDITTDKWVHLQKGMETVANIHIAKREARWKENMDKENNSQTTKETKG